MQMVSPPAQVPVARVGIALSIEWVSHSVRSTHNSVLYACGSTAATGHDGQSKGWSWAVLCCLGSRDRRSVRPYLQLLRNGTNRRCRYIAPGSLRGGCGTRGALGTACPALWSALAGRRAAHQRAASRRRTLVQAAATQSTRMMSTGSGHRA